MKSKNTKKKRVQVVGKKGPAMVNIPEGGVILDNEKSKFFTQSTLNERLLANIVKNTPDEDIFEKASNVYRSQNQASRPLLPGEYHYGFHNFTGSGTRIDLPQVLNTKPVNDVDRVSKIHDIEMANAKTAEDVERADQKAIEGYKKYKNQNGAAAALISIGQKTTSLPTKIQKHFVPTQSMGGGITNSTKLKNVLKAAKAGHLSEKAAKQVFSQLMQNLEKFKSRKTSKNRDMQSDMDDILHMSVKKLTTGKRLPKSVHAGSIRALQASFGSVFRDIGAGIEHFAGAAAKVAPFALPALAALSHGGQAKTMDQASFGSWIRGLAKKTKSAGKKLYKMGKKHVVPGFKKYVLPVLKEEMKRGGYDRKMANAAAKRIKESGVVDRNLNKISNKSAIAKAVIDHGRERKVISRMVGNIAGKEAQRAAQSHLNLAHGGKITHLLAFGGGNDGQQFIGYAAGGQPVSPEQTQQLIGYALGGKHTIPANSHIVGFASGGQLIHFDSGGNIIPTQNTSTYTHTGGFDSSGETVKSLTSDPPAVPEGVGKQNVAPVSTPMRKLLGQNGHGIYKGGKGVRQSAHGSKIRLGRHL